ncbi:MAG TPA: hypothetical protein VLS48_00305 [Anaerolineales bacterium]|nr:hypothetical protein [Anaerolineales bacterium]
MKVNTDLKAGGIMQDLSAQAGKAADDTLAFVSTANQQAQEFVGGVTNTFGSAWNTFKNLVFSR